MLSLSESRTKQAEWRLEKERQRHEAWGIAYQNYNQLSPAERNKKVNKDILKEAERQAQAARIWSNHVFLDHKLPDATNADDPNEWERKTDFGKNIPSLEDCCDVVAEALIKDKKLKDFDKTMPRAQRIDDIIQLLSCGKMFQIHNKTPATVKLENRNNYEYTPKDPTSTFTEKESGLCQSKGVLYEKIHKFVTNNGKPTNILTKNWISAQTLYDDVPNAWKLQSSVTALENIRVVWLMAHITEVTDNKGNTEIVHHGRDTTYSRLKQGISSSITKAVANSLVDLCPGCTPRVTAAKTAAEKAEPKRKEKRDAKRNAQATIEPEQDPAPKRRRRDGRQSDTDIGETIQFMGNNNLLQNGGLDQLSQTSQIPGGNFYSTPAETLAQAGKFNGKVNLGHFAIYNNVHQDIQNTGMSSFSAPAQAIATEENFDSGSVNFSDWVHQDDQDTATSFFSAPAQFIVPGSYQNPEPTGTIPANSASESGLRYGDINYLNFGGASSVEEPAAPENASEMIAQIYEEYPPGSLPNAVSEVEMPNAEPPISQPEPSSSTVPDVGESPEASEIDPEELLWAAFDLQDKEMANSEATASNIAEPAKEITSTTEDAPRSVTRGGLTLPTGGITYGPIQPIKPVNEVARQDASQETNEGDNESITTSTEIDSLVGEDEPTNLDYLFEEEPEDLASTKDGSIDSNNNGASPCSLAEFQVMVEEMLPNFCPN
ncbi:hypothetical protein BKA65DRAFT_568447 [Rhexocercosporidium sp. MPI-PUGE-AT-0058]|nr:hypothetical protein BKA65DRAFT_568447 [Rhexocercosporidium sp. MPI-PUGE-AT-0058]